MPPKQINSNKISLIKDICSQAIIDIDEIKKKRDKEISKKTQENIGFHRESPYLS